MTDKKMTDTQMTQYETLTASHNRAVAADLDAKMSEAEDLIEQLVAATSSDGEMITQARSALRMFKRQWENTVVPKIPAAETPAA